VIIRQRLEADGRALAIDAAGPGAAIMLSEGEGVAGYAVDEALLCLCPRRRFQGAVDAGAPTSGQVVALLDTSLERVERIAAARSRSTPISRVAALFTVLAETLSPPRQLSCLPPTLRLRDLAGLLALRHESVCRAIRSLARRGVVTRSAEGIRLLDRRRLARL
jgi:hypothetical protein